MHIGSFHADLIQVNLKFDTGLLTNPSKKSAVIVIISGKVDLMDFKICTYVHCTSLETIPNQPNFSQCEVVQL